MGLPIGRIYTATFDAKAAKHVTCEKCRCEYVYEMRRKIGGSGDSLFWLDNAGARERAVNRAAAAIDPVMSRECDLVPCPDCGWYQKNMIRKRRLQCFFTALCSVVATAGLVAVSFMIVAGTKRYYDRDIWFERAGISCIVTLIVGIVPLVTTLSWNYNRNYQTRSAKESQKPTNAIYKAEWDRQVAARQQVTPQPVQPIEPTIHTSTYSSGIVSNL